MKNTNMNTGAASLSDEQILDAIKSACDFDSAGVERWRTEALIIGRSVEKAVLAHSTSQADAAPSELASMTRMFHAACAGLGAINESLGLDPDDGGAEPILEAIAELRAAIAAGGAQEADAHIQALVDAAKNVFELANHFNVSGVYFTEDDENRDALQALEDRIEAVDRRRS